MMKSSQRLERLVSMVPWLITNNGASVSELARRFQYPEETLINDLTKVLFFVEPHPHTPGDLIEVNLYDDEVWINQAQFLAKPLRLKPNEAFSLLIKGKMLLALIEDGLGDKPATTSLSTALMKLSTSLNLDHSKIDLESGIRNSETYRTIHDGISLGQKLKIKYYSFNADKNTDRVVHPIAFKWSDRYLYLEAYCELAEGYRIFRLDRISNVETLAEPIDTAHTESVIDSDISISGELEFSFPNSEIAKLLIEREDEWIIAKYPTTNVELQEDGRLLVSLPVSTGTWLGRLLLRLKPGTELVESTTAISNSINEFGSLIDKIRNRYES